MNSPLRATLMLLSLLSWLAGAAPVRAQELAASLERNPIHAGESVRLVLELRRAAGGLKPDLSPLNQNFQILHTSANTQIEFVQGLQSAITRWTVELAPKHQGVLEVPSIAVGQFRSPALSLEVLAPRPDNSAEHGEILLEAEVTPDPAYVQAQMRYVVRLLRAVDVVDGTLTEPTATNAVLRRLGRDISYTTTRDGQSYRVLERRYALFPQTSGELVISPVEFEGEIVDPRQSATGLSRLFTRGKRVRLRTPVLRATARPSPSEYSGGIWLPAENLQLTEEWSTEPAGLRAGEPVTRTLRLAAVGLSAEQLPELRISATDGIKTYGDQPIIRTTTDTDWVHGVREQRIALVPASEGTYTLPEIRIAWWDTERDAPREAILAARTVQVAPAARDSAAAGAPAIAMPAASQPATPAPAPWRDPLLWQGLCAVLILLWVATLVAWRRARRTPARAASASAAVPQVPAPASLQRACRAGDAAAARAALLRWAASAWPEQPPRSLPALARRLSDGELRAQLEHLDRVLYAPAHEAWQGEALWRRARLGLVRPAPPRPSRSEHLPLLYPR